MAIDNLDLTSRLNNLKFRFNITKTAQKELDTFLAREFNVFSLFRTSELDLSEVLKVLLDPNGPHGQGPVFLNHFLKIVQAPTEMEPGNARVDREVKTRLIIRNQRSIDIMIEFGKSFVIGIENKPWARDQENQVSDYCDQLFRQCNENILMVYLTRDGSEPSSLSQDRITELRKPPPKLILLSYKTDIKKWLKLCAAECRADRVRWFLKDFERFIDEKFGLEGDIMQANEFEKVLEEFAKENPDNLETILRVAENVETVRRKIIVPFTLDLERRLVAILGNSWMLENEFRQDVLKVENNLKVWKDNWGPERFVFLQAKNFKEVCVGLTRGKAVSWPKEDAYVKAKLDETGGPGEIDQTWGWWRFLKMPDIPYDDWTNIRTISHLYWNREDALDFYSKEIIKVARAADMILCVDADTHPLY